MNIYQVFLNDNNTNETLRHECFQTGIFLPIKERKKAILGFVLTIILFKLKYVNSILKLSNFYVHSIFTAGREPYANVATKLLCKSVHANISEVKSVFKLICMIIMQLSHL